jgi:hypothetical protein
VLVEVLEDRLAPATLTVNSIADSAHGSDPYLTLREAIAIVNSPTLPSGLSDEILAQITGTLHGDGTDTIGFDPAQVTAPILLTGTLRLSLPSSTATVLIDGGPARVTLDGRGATPVLYVAGTADATIDHFTITRGLASYDGAAIHNDATVTVLDSTLSDNSSDTSGGGALANWGAMQVSGCTFTDNRAAGSGGGILNRSTLTVSDSTFSGNSAPVGGAIDNFTTGTGTIDDSLFDSNSSNYGGAVSNRNTLTVTGSTFRGNSASRGSGGDGSGGGIGSSGTLSVSNCTLTGNSATQGGGIAIGTYRSRMTVDNCVITSNSAGGGGGIHNDFATVTVSNSTISRNRAEYGGGINVLGSTSDLAALTTVSHSLLEANSGGHGAGLENGYTTVTMIDCTLRSNSSSLEGGGIQNYGTLTVSGCTLSSNTAGSEGGAIVNNTGLVTVSGSTLDSNTAASAGGAISSGSTLMVTDSTIVSNFTPGLGTFDGGGGISTGAALTVNHCTLSNNAAHQGGGIRVAGTYGTLLLQNSIVARNAGPSPDISGPVLGASSYNLISNRNGLSGISDGTNHNRIGSPEVPLDPLLAPLGYYGGPTRTMPPLPDSLALGGGGPTTALAAALTDTTTTRVMVANAALLAVIPNQTVLLIDSELLLVTAVSTNTLTVLRGFQGTEATPHTVNAPVFLATDQRGQPRLQDGQLDIGSFQGQSNPFLVTTLADPGQQPGLVSLREAVNLANVLPGDNYLSFDEGLGYGTLTLTAGQLELSGRGGVQTIDGGGRITVSAGNSSRLFQIDPNTQAVVRSFSLGNGSADNGGAVLNRGSLTLADSTLFSNSAGNGGAVYNQGTLTLYGSTLAFNTASLGGGLDNAGQLTAFNSTFFDNAAGTSGGAIHNAATGNATLTSLSISGNVADTGGGLEVEGGVVLLRNCIVAGNSSGDGSTASDIAGTVAGSSSYNLIGIGGSGGLSDGMQNNLVGVADPGLTDPDFSSNQTPVFGFTEDSPALGAGDPSLLSDPDLSLDQHGNPRSVVNIGAI